jgi:hypothetical protein
MSWHDEFWKSSVGVKGCKIKYGEKGFNESLCDWKGHVDCPSVDANVQSLCGYWLSATYDFYVNEAWYGIMKIRRSSKRHDIDILEPRLLYFQLKELWMEDHAIDASRSWYILALSMLLAAGAIIVGIELNKNPTRGFSSSSSFSQPLV